MEYGFFSRFTSRPGTSHTQLTQEHLALGKATEDLGFDTFRQGHEQFQPELFLGSAPFLIASAVAALTERIKIGFAVLQLPLDHPLRVAQDIATVDQISRGRLVVGIGRGGYDYPYQPYKIPYLESTGRSRESLEIMIKAWTEERFSHRGEFWNFEDVSVGPKPYQMPHPPIAMAAFNTETFCHPGEQGYTLLVNLPGDRTRLEPHLDEYREAWQTAGHPGSAKILALINVYVGDTPQQAYSEPEATVMKFFRFVSYWGGTPLPGLDEEANLARAERARRRATVTYDEFFRTDLFHGTAESVAEKLQAAQEEMGYPDL